MSGSIPKYKQIYETLKLNIFSNDYSENSLFPTENELIEEYQASRTTVRNALKLLHDDGLIESRRGIGTIVTVLNLPTHAQLSRLTDIEKIEFYYNIENPEEEKSSDPIIDITPAAENVARALDVPCGTNIYRIRWLHSVNNKTYNFLTNYIRMDFAPDLDKRMTHMISLYRFLSQEYGLEFIDAKEEIEPLCANFIEARFLDVEIGKPLLKLSRTAYCSIGPLEYSESIVNPDILKITMHLKSKLIAK